MRMIAQYPYRNTLQHMGSAPSSGSISTHADAFARDFQTFVTELAARFLRSDNETRMRLASDVQNSTVHAQQWGPSRSVPQARSASNLGTQGMADAPSNSDGDRVVEAARYTMALKEYGDHNAVSVTWRNELVSLSPVCWKVAAIVDSASFPCTACSTKEAKHLASRMACESLGIEL